MSDRPSPSPGASMRQSKHTRSPKPSYDPARRTGKVNRNPSPTRPPLVEADQGTWAHWQDCPIEALDLDAFAANGTLLHPDRVFSRWGV